MRHRYRGYCFRFEKGDVCLAVVTTAAVSMRPDCRRWRWLAVAYVRSPSCKGCLLELLRLRSRPPRANTDGRPCTGSLGPCRSRHLLNSQEFRYLTLGAIGWRRSLFRVEPDASSQPRSERLWREVIRRYTPSVLRSIFTPLSPSQSPSTTSSITGEENTESHCLHEL